MQRNARTTHLTDFSCPPPPHPTASLHECAWFYSLNSTETGLDGNHRKVQPTSPASRLRPETRKAGLLGPPAVIQPQALCSALFGTVPHVVQPHCKQQKCAPGYRQATRLREAPRMACWLG